MAFTKDTFESIQKSFQARAFIIAPEGQPAENILKGKVICGCCGGKMQRKRGSDHADWHFFTCITKNWLGAGRCTGMYAREEDVFNAIYHQLKLYINEYFISAPQYKQQIRQLNEQIEHTARCQYEASENFRLCYEELVKGKKGIEDLQAARDIANQTKADLDEFMMSKAAYEEQYQMFHKLPRVNGKELPLAEIIGCIDKVVVDAGKYIEVEWFISKRQR